MQIAGVVSDGADPLAGVAETAAASFELFYAATARDLWAYAAATLGDPTLADDIVQETFVRYLRCGVRFADDAHRRAYLFRVASHRMLDERRRAHRRYETHPEPSPIDGESEPVTNPHTIADALDLRAGLARLSPRERSLLWLAHVEGFSHQEIGARLGTQPGSVRVLLHRARRRLAKILSFAAGGHRKESRP
jgi:RNA polymerase sigma-70 factor (ECF subfamily)